MKYCPITPTDELGRIPHTGAYFTFAELALKDWSYCTFHRSAQLLDADGPVTVIMDTFVYEGLGGVLTNTELLEANSRLRPTHIIAPDIPNDAVGTIARFNELWGMRLLMASTDTRPYLVGVIQGRNLPEMIRCARALGSMTDWLAIPTRMPNGIARSKLLDALINDAGFHKHNFHLLGQAQDGFSDDVRCASFPQVKTLDSKKAISAALQNIDLEVLNNLAIGVHQGLVEKWGRTDPGTRMIIHSDDDFFDQHLNDRQLELARKNVGIISGWLR